MPSGLKLNIRTKLTWAAITLFMILFLINSFISISVTENALLDQVVLSVKDDVALHTQDLTLSFHLLKTDILLLSKLPAVQGMIHARANNGFDKEGNSTYEEWASRLEDIFVTLAESNENYVQVRYLDENGLELVRINYDGENARIVSKPELQNKSNRYYFSEAMQVGKNEVYVSRLDLNREGPDQALEVPYVPVLRYATPVFDENNVKRGIIITNIKVDNLFAPLGEQHASEGTGFLFIFLNQNGYYLLNTKDSNKTFGDVYNLDTGASFIKDYPNHASQVLSGNKGTIVTNDFILAYAPLRIKEDLEKYWIVAKLTSREVAMMPIIALRNSQIIISLITLFLLILTSWTVAGWFSKPILELKNAASEFKKGNLSYKIKIKSKDEIGDLAKEFMSMAKELDANRREVTKYSKGLESTVKTRTQDVENQRKAAWNLLEDLQESKEKLETSYKELKSVDKLKDEFISISSHELKTPLTSIKAYSNLFAEGSLGKLSKEQKKSFGVIERNVTRLSSLVSDILDVSRLESGSRPLNKTRFDLSAVANDVLESLKPAADKQGIKLSSKYSDKFFVTADKARIIQVLNNLLSNSLKFTPTKGKIELSLKDDGKDVLVSVSDTGKGVAKKELTNIFRKFYQLEPAATHSLPGTGLGLSICRLIVEAHSGKIWAERKGLGKGLTVFFTLPKRVSFKK